MVTFILSAALWASIWRDVVTQCHAVPCKAVTTPPDSPMKYVTLGGGDLGCAEHLIIRASQTLILVPTPLAVEK